MAVTTINTGFVPYAWRKPLGVRKIRRKEVKADAKISGTIEKIGNYA